MLETQDDYTSSERFRTLANALPERQRIVCIRSPPQPQRHFGEDDDLDMGGSNRLDLDGDVAKACEIQASPTDYMILVHEPL